MTAPLLQVENLEAGYGPINVLHRLSLTVAHGEIVTMIGANGAGKTTTLMCVSGVVKARAGKIVFDGAGLVADRVPAHNIVRLVSQCPRAEIFSDDGARKFRWGHSPALIGRRKADIEGIRCSDLQKPRSQAGGLLSGGEQQMLAIARARRPSSAARRAIARPRAATAFKSSK